MSLRLTLVAATALAAIGCTFGATEVLVTVDTDLPLAGGLVLSVTARNGSAAIADDAMVDHAWSTLDGGLRSLPASFAVVPESDGPGDTTVTLLVAATAGEVTVRRLVRFRFTPREALVLPVFLAARCAAVDSVCSGLPCSHEDYCESMGATCGEDGQCTSVDVVPTPSGDAAVFDLAVAPERSDIVVAPDVPSVDVALDEALDTSLDVPPDIFVCPPSEQLCGAVCVSDDDVANCGHCGNACTAPASGTATCTGGACGFTCNAGHHVCGALCASNSSVATCGASCTACTAPTDATATCNGTACGWTCNAGYTHCGSGCVDTVTDANDCGSCGNVCTSYACQASTCVGFAGAWAATSTSCVMCNADPISGGCGCPGGPYITENSVVIENDCGAALNGAVMYVCASSRLDANMYGGIYEQDDPVGCGVGCRTTNAYTGACACPAGTTAHPLRTLVPTGCGNIGSTLEVCYPPAADGSFGGFYQQDDPVTGGMGCRHANPFTGACSCPAGYSGASFIRVIADISTGPIGTRVHQCTR